MFIEPIMLVIAYFIFFLICSALARAGDVAQTIKSGKSSSLKDLAAADADKKKSE
jgi:VanZ family protein